jgi:hypothetical protein
LGNVGPIVPVCPGSDPAVFNQQLLLSSLLRRQQRSSVFSYMSNNRSSSNSKETNKRGRFWSIGLAGFGIRKQH